MLNWQIMFLRKCGESLDNENAYRDSLLPSSFDNFVHSVDILSFRILFIFAPTLALYLLFTCAGYRTHVLSPHVDCHFRFLGSYHGCVLPYVSALSYGLFSLFAVLWRPFSTFCLKFEKKNLMALHAFTIFSQKQQPVSVVLKA